MKYLAMVSVLTLSMLSPALAMNVHHRDGAFLVASKKDDGKKKPVIVIKGEGGKVKDVKKKKKR